MNTYILDTNVFFNMEAGIGLGKTTEEVVRKITTIAKKLKKTKKAVFVMSPRVVDEFLSFFEDKNQAFLQDLISVVMVKSPEIDTRTMSLSVFYDLVENIRLRSYRGLSIGEDEIKNTAKAFLGKNITDKKDLEIAVGKHIRSFRERYRNTTRTGFIDSLADLDCIFLAKTLDGYLISTDEGVISWGRKFGVKETPVTAWAKQMQELLLDE